MSLCDILEGFKNKSKPIDVKTLPSMGLFYNDDFEIKIKKASAEDIKKYENEFDKEDLGLIISKIKIIVENKTLFSTNYKFDDLKSIDVVFLFIEIVKYTKGKEISIDYLDEESHTLKKINFNSETFNYFKPDDDLLKNYDSKNKLFKIDDYLFSLPSIGIENSISYFLIESNNPNKYTNLNFNFSYFLDKKEFLTFEEIENLIEIFNFDLSDDEKAKIENIIKKFKPLQRYSLIKNGKEIDINSKMDLEFIWK
jgi:hypothetical protein